MDSPSADGCMLRGFRKRWASAGGSSSALSDAPDVCELDDHDINPDNYFAKRPRPQVEQRCDPEPASSSVSAVVIVDDDGDEPGLMQTSLPASRSSRPHRQEQDMLLNTSLDVFKYPWEKGRLASIFSDKPLVRAVRPRLHPGGRNPLELQVGFGNSGNRTVSAVFKPESSSHAVFLDVVKKADDVSVLDDRELKRKTAIQGWWQLLSHSLSSSAFGRNIIVEANLDTAHECATKNLDAIFALKSPGTLFRRLYAMQSFEAWSLEKRSEHWLPVTEAHAWQYVLWLEDTKAPPTKATSFLEGLRFCWFLLGVDGCDTCEQSLRVKGVASQMRAKKRAWRPADLLTVEEVTRLHSILEDNERPSGDRVIVGHLLHVLYSRSRWSDLQAVSGLHIDVEERYIEVATRLHKGARSSEMRSRLLPIVAPCFGVTAHCWARTYVNLRRKLGLFMDESEPGPMMKVPMNAEATMWSERAMSSEEGADFMRRLLAAPKTPERRIATHSLKSTTMSWCSKFGMSEQSRAVLARHTSSIANATAVYSRDLLSPVLREYDNLLNNVRLGLFAPDSTRSGMVISKTLQAAGTTPMPRTPLPCTPVFVSHGKVKPVNIAQQPAEEDMSGSADEKQQCNTSSHDAPTSQDDSWLPVDKHTGVSDITEGESSWPVVSDSQQTQEGDQHCANDATAVSDDSSEEDDSEQSTSSSDQECNLPSADRQPLFEVSTNYFINASSLVIHCMRDALVFRCGRKLTPSYIRVNELHGVRCSRCFDL